MTNPSAGDTFESDYSVTLNASWDAANVSVVAILVDHDTYEIYQVEEADIN